MACGSFLWLMKGLFLFGQSDLFWIQCTSLFHNQRNKGAFLQWSVAPLFLLQYYNATCYNLSLGHMGFLCSLKIYIHGVGCCCRFLSRFQPVHDGGWFTWSKIWTSKGAENIINWQYLVLCNLPFSYILLFSCLANDTMDTFLRSLNALFQLHIWRNSTTKCPDINITCISRWSVGSHLICSK